jgi:hypothetical protein
VKKPERSLRRFFQAAVEIYQENVAEGVLSRFPRLWQFPQAPPLAKVSFFLLLFLSLWRKRFLQSARS